MTSSLQEDLSSTKYPVNISLNELSVGPGDISKSETSINQNINSSTVELAASPHSAGHPISNFETVIHLIKGNIGTGIFALPSAFLNAGLWFSLVALPLIAAICIHCMHLLTSIAEELLKQNGEFSPTYATVAQSACLIGAPQFRKYANLMKNMINTFTIITQFGFCCVYIVFIGDNMREFIIHVSGVDWDPRIYMVIATLPLIFLNWIRDLRWLTPFSFLGNFLLAFTIVVVLVYVFQDLPPITDYSVFGSWKGLPLFFGTALFTYEGISLVLPIHKDMKTPQYFTGFCGLMNVGMIFITIGYVSIAFLGYWRYGDDIKPSIILNLPQDSVIAQCTKLMMVLSICTTYAMQFFVPLPFIMPTLLKLVPCLGNGIAAENVIRTLLVLFISALAIAIPRLDLFISLVGSVGCSALGLIIPPMLHLMVYWETIHKAVLVKDFLIITFGIVGTVTGTYSSLEAIITAFS